MSLQIQKAPQDHVSRFSSVMSKVETHKNKLLFGSTLIMAFAALASLYNKKPEEFVGPITFKDYVERQTGGEHSIINKIANTVGGLDSFRQLPHLPWNQRFLNDVGGYIDGVRASDMKYPVMWGIDPANCLYISLKLQDANQKSNIGVETLFQRFTGRQDTWTSGSRAQPLRINETQISFVTTTVKDDHIARFAQLIKGETVTIDRMDTPYQIKLASK